MSEGDHALLPELAGSQGGPAGAGTPGAGALSGGGALASAARGDSLASTGRSLGASHPRVVERRTTVIALCGVMAALLAVASWITVPFYPVPFTLQTLAVLVAGGLLGRVWGPVSVLVYLLVGVVGVPVFAGFQGGPGVLFGFLGGFLVGFVLAAFAMGTAADAARRRGLGTRGGIALLAVGAACAALVVYVPGLAWFVTVTEMSVSKALGVAFFPFLFPDALKAVAAVVLIRAVDRALGDQGLGRSV